MAEQTQEQETQQPAVQSTMSAAPKQLAATDILSKMQTGTPLVQGEKLPDVPKGMSAKSFYGQFPGGAAVYSQAPFKQPTYGQVTTPAPATPVSPPADTTPVDTAPIVEEEENLTGGDSPEDTALDEAIAESTSTSTQMDDLFDFNIDSGYTFDYDSNLTLTENIANEFEDFGLALTADISSVTDGTVVLNDIDKTLTNIGTSLNTAYNNALQEGEDSLLSFIDETKSILADIEAYAANPETIATDTFNYVSEALTDFYDNLSLMTQPDHPDFDLALQDLATGVTKGMMGAVIGAITGVPVIGTLFVELVTNSEFFSNAMIGYPGQTETVTWNNDTKTYDVEYTPTNFDSQGIARDTFGKEVLTGRGGVATSGPTFVVPGHGIFAKPTDPEIVKSTMADPEGGANFDVYGQMDVAVTPGDLEYGGGGGTDIGGGTGKENRAEITLTPEEIADLFADLPDTPASDVPPSVVKDDKPFDPLADPTTIDRPDDGTVVDSGVTPSGIDMGGSVTSVQVQDNLENRTMDVDITDTQGKVDNFSVEAIANEITGTVTLDTLYSLLATLYDPSMMPDPTKGISRDPEVVNKRGIDAVLKAIEEKERNITLKGGSAGDDTLDEPYDAGTDFTPGTTIAEQEAALAEGDEGDGYDAGSDFGAGTTEAEQESAMAEGDTGGDDSGSDGSGNGGEDEAGAEAGDI